MEDIKEAWHFDVKEAMVGMKEYLKLAFLTAGLVCLEFWSWNVFVFMSSYISVNTNSAMTGVTTLMITLYTFAFGMSVATSVVVGI